MIVKQVPLGALIIEAMREDNSLMPDGHPNGVSIDTLTNSADNTMTVEGYWVAPDTGGRYYISADVKVTPTGFSYCPDDYDDLEDDEPEEDDE